MLHVTPTLDLNIRLATACVEGDVATMRESIEQGANPDQVDKDGNSLLHFACQEGQLQAVVFLVERKLAQLTTGDLTKIESAKDIPQHIDLAALSGFLQQSNKHGIKPMHDACDWRADFDREQEDRLAIVRYLRSWGAVTDCKTPEGDTPLLIACREGNLKVAHYLMALNNGQAIHDKNNRHETPLHAAAANSHDDIMAWLVDLGHDPNAKTLDGETPLHLACEYARDSTIRLLILLGADIDAEDRQRNRPDISVLGEAEADTLTSMSAQERAAFLDKAKKIQREMYASAFRYVNPFLCQLTSLSIDLVVQVSRFVEPGPKLYAYSTYAVRELPTEDTDALW